MGWGCIKDQAGGRDLIGHGEDVHGKDRGQTIHRGLVAAAGRGGDRHRLAHVAAWMGPFPSTWGPQEPRQAGPRTNIFENSFKVFENSLLYLFIWLGQEHGTIQCGDPRATEREPSLPSLVKDEPSHRPKGRLSEGQGF